MSSPPEEFVAPGPGTWTTDRVHVPRPRTLLVSEVTPPALAKGFGETFRRYGMPLGDPTVVRINGWEYGQRAPLPPEEIPARIAAAATVYPTKLWRTDLDRWDNEVKPDSRARNGGLASVDAEALDDAALVEHLRASHENLSLMVTRHHLFNGVAILPVGDLVAHANGWGVPAQEVLALMKGASPASGGDCEETTALADAVRGDPEALALVQSADADAGAVFAVLRSRPAPVGPATEAFIAFVGHRPLDGFDICEPIALEKPEFMLVALRHALAGPRVVPDVDAEAQRIRDLVPEDQRETFDELLAEARLTYRVRDERGVYQDVWAYGILRRAVLAGGARLAAAGRIAEAEHLVDARFDEIVSLLASGGGPSADELAARHTARVSARPEDAPDFLGDPPKGPPQPAEGIPPEALRVLTAFGAALTTGFMNSDKTHDTNVVRGIPVKTGTYEGTARVLSGPSELWRIEDGDVLVTQSTTEAFNLVLPILGGIVVDHGGLLSHSAIVAREFGLPCVVGTRQATTLIPDGARVRVDGDSGEVHILSS